MSVPAERSPAPPDADLLFSPPPSQTPSQTSGQSSGHGGSSPSGMLEERNADSVLFKVDALKEMAKAQAAEGGAKRQLARLAAPAPQSETGSGLIDLRSLASGTPSGDDTAGAPGAAPVRGQAASSASVSQSNLLRGSSPSVQAATPTAASAPRPTPPSRTPLVILSVLAVVALCAAVAALILRG